MKPQKSQSSENLGYFHRIFQSIFPDPIIPKSEQERKRYLLKNLILHFRPATIPEKTLKFSLTWGLGGMAVILVLLQFGTGLLLKFVYEPTPVGAYTSILMLQNEVVFGQLIRNMHHWSANLLVLIVFMHMLRVFFTNAFHPPRQFNWIVGLGLFSLVLIANFTGYLLPYDQLAYWAVTVSTGMLEYIPGLGVHLQEMVRGGSDIGPATLSIFFAIHTALVPFGLIILMAFHFWRTRKAGGLVIPRRPQEDIEEKPIRVPTVPNLLVREVVTALVLLAFILVFAMVFNAPLESKANPGLSPNPTKAPWYFTGIQEMLMHFHPSFSLFIIPILMMIALLGLPYIDYESKPSGVWFGSYKGRKMAVVAAITATIATPAGILTDEYLVDLAAWMQGVPAFISNGLIPFVVVLAGSIGFYILIKRKYSATNNEAIQALFVLFLASFIILTATGIWLRGMGMKLMLPF
ncbi:MAG: cytochrome b N-terminal domain-containing protein [Desulfobacterales bacterium]|nr:MAG: cytochrome b N-terminal domain-containing protein [Desulfobacterales bacterium]